MVSVTFLTTTNQNVGDDFVREGIVHLLREAAGSRSLSFANIHKHVPLTARRGFDWCRDNRIGRVIDRILPLTPGWDRILDADVLVHAGAPIYWCHPNTHCGAVRWINPILERRFKRHPNMPYLVIGGGSCQTYASDGAEIGDCAICAPYVRELHRMAQVTTLRDTLAGRILNLLGSDAPVLPCPSIFARDALGAVPADRDYVVLNYMHGAGHFDLEQHQPIDVARWEKVFRSFYHRLSREEDCLFACHNEAEERWARAIDPNARIFRSHNFRDYLPLYAGAKFAVTNRVHAAFVVASFGRPAFAVGTDSRVRMMREIGLREAFVNDVEEDRLMEEVIWMRRGADDFEQRFEAIRSNAYTGYMSALSATDWLPRAPT